MTPELDTKLVEAISSITTNLTQAKSFVLSELPDVLQQFIMFNTFKSVGYTALGLLLMIICILALRSIFKTREEKGLRDVDTEPFVIALLFLVIGFLFFCANFMETVQLLMAPKVWLLENIHSLIRIK